MTTSTDIINTSTKPLAFTFTVHLPGLKKTVKMTYDKTLDKPMELFNFITNSFGIVSRRAALFLIVPNNLPVSVNEFSLLFNKIHIKDGDTFIVCVRETTVTGENEYYENQKESLQKNKYLDPPISKNTAVYLLGEIERNFDLCGHKHFMPGGQWYEYRKIVDAQVSPYYNEKTL